MSMDVSITNNEFAQHLGLEFISLTKKEAVAKFPFSKSLCNPYGSIHGGVLYSVADIVCGTLACTCGFYCTTIDGHMQYLYPAAATEYIICEARIVKSGAHIVFTSCDLKTDKGIVIDTATFSFFKTNVSSVDD